MLLFYSSHINIPLHELNEEESKHCINVLRLKKGDVIFLVNGLGGIYKAHILEPNVKKCRVEIIETLNNFNKHNYYLHIAIALTKNIERIEWFVEKAVEIGVDEISPIICERSERKIVKIDRLKKIAIAAMKQSLKAYLPKINNCIEYKQFANGAFIENKCIAHCLDDSNKLLLQNYIKPKESALILIGPEGDFSPSEIKLAINKNYQEISLGNSRLRTETAGIVACDTLAFINN